MRPALEVADIFRRHGEAFGRNHGAHLGRIERRIMAAIEACRTPVLGGHLEQCGDCGLLRCAYNSCRNRHCPKCQGLARAEWLEARHAELLPVPYYHVVFTLPALAAEIAFQNKRVVYAILFFAAARALCDNAADPKHLGAEIGAVSLLHTCGQALQHHPHLHCIVPGGGLSSDGTRWVSCRPGFFLPVRVLSRRFRELFLARLQRSRRANCASLAHSRCWPNLMSSLDVSTRYAHSNGWSMPSVRSQDPRRCWPISAATRTAWRLANSRLTRLADGHIDFTWKDYRHHGKTKVMTLAADEFIRRFLLHAIPDGFHRIRHIGFLANGHRTAKLAVCRMLLAAPAPDPPTPESYRERVCRLTGHALDVCPDCGGAMLERGTLPRRPRPHRPYWCDSS
jgi:hypothetical protein